MKKKAFTLIEMVVVVLVLGIVAAVAAPRMFNTADTAAENASRSTLNILRNAIELYASENEGVYPPGATFADALSPYLNGEFPAPQVGTNKGISDVFVVTTVPADSVDELEAAGWVYNETTGLIAINSDDLSQDGVGFQNW